jgi:protein phosphatase
MTASLRWGAATHEGQIRDQNEDAYVANDRVFLVADGMGGHQAGEVASELAIAAIRDHLGEITSIDDLVGLVRDANRQILAEARADDTRQGMGTTLTGLVLLDGDEPELAVVNVGDSRTYRLRHGELRRLTIDHSYVQELVNDGVITTEEARLHPRRNIVTRALGIEEPLDVDAWTVPVVRGDRFLICSDGLVDEVPEPEIRDVVVGVEDPQQAAEQLVDMALRHGGRDNVTVVVVDVLDGLDPVADVAELTQELAEEPHWAEGPADPTWSTDTDQPTTAVAATIEVAAPEPAVEDAESAELPVVPKRRRGGIGVLLFWLAITAIIGGTFVLVAAYARSGYFVGFQGDDVVIFKGRPGGVLWFDPTVERPTQLTRDQLDAETIRLIESEPTRDSLDAAAELVRTLQTTTTTTTTVPPTTTVAPSTTRPPPTTTAPAPGTTGG